LFTDSYQNRSKYVVNTASTGRPNHNEITISLDLVLGAYMCDDRQMDVCN